MSPHLKRFTTLTREHQHSKSISQGIVATRLRCGGTFNNQNIVNLLLSVPVKTFENRPMFNKC